jgi:hypothetical protein
VLVRSITLRVRPHGEVAGLALETVLLALTAVVWVVNPYASILLLPAAHLMLPLSAVEMRPRPPIALALVALALAPVALLAAYFAHHLSLGLGASAWMIVSMLAGGAIGIPAALAWSLAGGCAIAAALIALSPAHASSRARAGGARGDDPRAAHLRGPRFARWDRVRSATIGACQKPQIAPPAPSGS